MKEKNRKLPFYDIITMGPSIINLLIYLTHLKLYVKEIKCCYAY